MKVKNLLSSILAAITSFAVALPALALTGTINRKVINIHSGPGRKYSVVRSLHKGDKVKVTGQHSRGNNSWFLIVGQRGGEGWIPRYSVTLDSENSASSAQEKKYYNLGHQQGKADSRNAKMYDPTLGVFQLDIKNQPNLSQVYTKGYVDGYK